jgi:hypothetical protein
MQNTFGIALKVVWQVVFGISIAGMLFKIGVKQLKLHSEINEDWGREHLLDDRGWSFRSSLLPTQQATNVDEGRSE